MTMSIRSSYCGVLTVALVACCGSETAAQIVLTRPGSFGCGADGACKISPLILHRVNVGEDTSGTYRVNGQIAVTVEAECIQSTGPKKFKSLRSSLLVLHYDESLDPTHSEEALLKIFGPKIASIDVMKESEDNPPVPGSVVSTGGGRMDGAVQQWDEANKRWFVQIVRKKLEENVVCTGACALADCGDGKAIVSFLDPFVLGEGTYVSSDDGQTYNAAAFSIDGQDLFHEETFSLDVPGVPQALPAGSATRGETFRVVLIPGADDSGDDLAGEVFYELAIEETASGRIVDFQPGSQPFHFNYSFDKTEQEIEAEILAHLEGQGPAPSFTARATLIPAAAASRGVNQFTLIRIDGGEEAFVTPLCLGNADKIAPGSVDFGDVTAVLGNWLADYGSGTGPGDANGDGSVNFTDLTSVLGNWLSFCP